MNGPDSHPFDLKAALREAAAAGGVALLLTLPLVGLRTAETMGGLVIRPRFGDVAVTVLLAIYLPLLGASLIVVLLLEQLVLRRIPPVARWLGLPLAQAVTS